MPRAIPAPTAPHAASLRLSSAAALRETAASRAARAASARAHLGDLSRALRELRLGEAAMLAGVAAERSAAEERYLARAAEPFQRGARARQLAEPPEAPEAPEARPARWEPQAAAAGSAPRGGGGRGEEAAVAAPRALAALARELSAGGRGWGEDPREARGVRARLAAGARDFEARAAGGLAAGAEARAAEALEAAAGALRAAGAAVRGREALGGETAPEPLRHHPHAELLRQRPHASPLGAPMRVPRAPAAAWEEAEPPAHPEAAAAGRYFSRQPPTMAFEPARAGGEAWASRSFSAASSDEPGRWMGGGRKVRAMPPSAFRTTRIE